MAGIDENITIFGDWATANPSPRTFISNFFNEDTCSRSFPDLGDSEHIVFMESENQKTAMSSNKKVNKSALEPSSDIFFEPVQLNVPKSSSRGALSERMAARAGFSTLTVNTNRNGTEDAISSPDKRSSCLLLSPGVSPTSLLESPVFLSNSLAQPSPTTGKFSFVHIKGNNPFSTLISAEINESKVQQIEDVNAEAFTFPCLGSSFPFLSHAENKIASSIGQTQSLANMGASHQPDLKHPVCFKEASGRKESAEDMNVDSFIGNESSPPIDVYQNGEKEPKGEFSSMPISAPAEDGYNWRKYGQKQVKGSECPRSYYKCTCPNCPVKKKVERSLDGHVTEIIYKGAHNHTKPPPNRRSCTAASHSFSDTQMDGADYHVINANFDGKLSFPNTQNGSGGSEWRGDGMEATSSASVSEFATSNSVGGSRYDCSEVMHLSSAMSNDEEEDDGATNGSFSTGCDAEGEEMDSKRRKQDLCPIDMSAASRAMREPRVVVQTTSEVDILDDGYRWRKYGQKVVKGNPNPRSYYKCTNPGCTVRKHVERASHDLKSVITTYEGKHNHDVPTAKTSNNQSSSGLSISTPPSMQQQQPHNLHRRADPAQDNFMRFETHLPIDPFAFPGSAAGFALGIGHHPGLTGLGIAGLGPIGPMGMPIFTPVHPYLEHHGSRFLVPKGEPKEEPTMESDLPSLANAPKGYHQFADRLPLGPYLYE